MAEPKKEESGGITEAALEALVLKKLQERDDAQAAAASEKGNRPLPRFIKLNGNPAEDLGIVQFANGKFVVDDDGHAVAVKYGPYKTLSGQPELLDEFCELYRLEHVGREDAIEGAVEHSGKLPGEAGAKVAHARTK